VLIPCVGSFERIVRITFLPIPLGALPLVKAIRAPIRFASSKRVARLHPFALAKGDECFGHEVRDAGRVTCRTISSRGALPATIASTE
jgi:hypothetical protein